MKPGKLIIIEGIDGSGKDTQADLLVEQHGCVKTRLPDYKYKTGELVRSYIKAKKYGVSEEVFQTVMAANYIEHLQTFILPEIQKGNNVVMTRYLPSMKAYGTAFGIDISFLNDLTKLVYSKYLQSIGVLNIEEIYLQIPVEIGMKRIRKRAAQTGEPIEEIFENPEILDRVSQSYEKHAFNLVVDGESSIEEVNEEIQSYLKLS